MTNQQIEACKLAYQKLLYWNIDLADFLGEAEKLEKERQAYLKIVEAEKQKIKIQTKQPKK